MITKKSTKVKTIASDNAFDFDTRLNGFTDKLDAQGIPYEVQLNPTAGYLAFVTYKKEVKVAENAKDRYELLGERHECRECPFYVIPTDGRVRHTRCSITKDEEGNPSGQHTRRDSCCCEEFYELLEKGRIQLKGE